MNVKEYNKKMLWFQCCHVSGAVCSDAVCSDAVSVMPCAVVQ